jgi:hypothetical protein
MQDLLSDWYDSVKKAPRKKREGQEKEHRLAIVYHASEFLFRCYAYKLSTNPKTSIHKFVELFYERVTATRPERGFDYQFRLLATTSAAKSEGSATDQTGIRGTNQSTTTRAPPE